MGHQLKYTEIMRDQSYGALFNPTTKGQLITALNDAPRAKQVDTITVTGASAKTYQIEIDGIAITATLSGSPTTQDVVDALVAAVNAEALVNARVLAEGATSSTLTLTARRGGVGFTTTESDADLTLANTTANAEAADVPFGRAVMFNGQVSEGRSRRLLAQLVDASQLTAKSVEITYGSGTIRVGVRLAGGELQEVSGTTAALLATALNGIDGLDATEAAGVITLTAETAGLGFEVAYINGAADITAQTAGDDLNDIIAGVSVSIFHVEQQGDGDGLTNDTVEYEGGSEMSVLRKDSYIFIETEETISYSDVVWVRLVATGSQKLGVFRGSYSDGCVPLAGYRFVASIDSSKAVLEPAA